MTPLAFLGDFLLPFTPRLLASHLKSVGERGLTTAFRLWQKQQASVPSALTTVLPTLSSALLGGEGMARWRQRLEEENRDKIIVFIGQDYGIFHLAEFALITHLPLRRLPASLGSPQAVLQHFGISP